MYTASAGFRTFNAIAARITVDDSLPVETSGFVTGEIMCGSAFARYLQVTRPVEYRGWAYKSLDKLF